MSLGRSVYASTLEGLVMAIPCEGEGEPVGQSPCHEANPFGQPYAAQSLFIWPGAGSEIYGNEEYDANGESEGKEDGKDEVGRGCSERQEMAEEKENEDGDECKGQECESV